MQGLINNYIHLYEGVSRSHATLYEFTFLKFQNYFYRIPHAIICEHRNSCLSGILRLAMKNILVLVLAAAMEKSNFEQRAVIRFLLLQKKSATEIHQNLVSVYQECAL